MKKILIIEDEKFLSEMYKMKFIEEGFKVETANNGCDGIELAEKINPDLVLLDLVLPGMDGYEILEKLRASPKTKGIKVYILSNLGQTEEINKGFKIGADGYLIKANLTPTQLAQSVNKIFSGQKVGLKKQAVSAKKSVAKAKVIENGKSVLIIEDEVAIVEMYKLRLEKAGFRVELAKNGAWGIKLAKEKDFDIIVMDIVMPAMNGYNAIKALKVDKKTKDVPIIALSNSAQDKDIKKAKQYGAACYLLKAQITPVKLIDEIKKLLKV